MLGEDAFELSRVDSRAAVQQVIAPTTYKCVIPVCASKLIIPLASIE